MTENFKAGPLKKVSVEIIPQYRGRTETAGFSRAFEFIYGIGVEGLSPFEAAIGGASAGDTIRIESGLNDSAAFFGHLLPCGVGVEGPDRLSGLEVRVRAVSEPDPREVVRAMAGSSACGSDCGCGCGSHGQH